MTLSPGHRIRKASQTLELIERSFRAGDFSAAAWIQELVSALAGDPGLAADARLAVDLHRLLNSFWADPVIIPNLANKAAAEAEAGRSFRASSLFADPYQGIRKVNSLRRGLEALVGRAPADWDFMEPLGTNPDAAGRSVFPGMRAYLEDIRSPFNIGSMFRTADAFGLAELLLSGFSADPGHPRAERSAMGASLLIPWRRVELEDLAGLGEVFALELRGESVDSFDFPERGVVVLGSEELGVSPEALNRCVRRVSIPMLGAKGSLNVGVAFGILLDAWRRNLSQRGIKPCLPAQFEGLL